MRVLHFGKVFLGMIAYELQEQGQL